VTKARLQTGAAGEQIACNFLQEQGYRIIERNHRSSSRLGELDIIAAYGEFLIFSKVKTRRDSSGQRPSLSVTAKKLESCANWVSFISARSI